MNDLIRPARQDLGFPTEKSITRAQDDSSLCTPRSASFGAADLRTRRRNASFGESCATSPTRHSRRARLQGFGTSHRRSPSGPFSWARLSSFRGRSIHELNISRVDTGPSLIQVPTRSAEEPQPARTNVLNANEPPKLPKFPKLRTIEPPNKLEITIIRARNLPAKDKNIFTGKRSADPKVVVKLRERQATTKTRYNTVKPMFNETFDFHVTDPSTVLHVSVLDEDLTNSEFIGQWIMTLKYIIVDPAYCYHLEEGYIVEKEDPNDVTIRGWFPLMSRKWDKLGERGEVEMQIRWYYNPALPSEYVAPQRSALQNLEANSRETQLRLGNRERVTTMLDNQPVLFNIHRVNMYNIHFFLQDLFRGTKGHAERLRNAGKSSDDARKIKIPALDFSTAFRPRKGEPGISCYRVVYAFFVRGLLPKVFNQNILGSALTQTLNGFIFNFASTAQSLFRGDHDLIKMFQVRRGLAVGIRSYAVHVRKKLQGGQANLRVDAEDEEFLSTSTHEGYLLKGSVSKQVDFADIGYLCRFKVCHFQLKGRSLFYRPLDGTQHRKIPIEEVQLVALDRARQSIYLHRKSKLTVLQVFAMSRSDGHGRQGRFQAVVDDSVLLAWFEALKTVGVNHMEHPASPAQSPLMDLRPAEADHP